MQTDNTHFLPYFFTEPIYFRKQDFVQDQIKEGKTLEEPATSAVDLKNEPLLENEPLVKEPVEKLEATPEIVHPARVLEYAGKNLKKILILFENPNQEKLPSAQELFLGKILHAVNLNFDDIALVNAARLDDALMRQVSDFDAIVQISFGVKNLGLDFKPDTPPYKIFKARAKTLLLADHLEAIERDKEKKVSLWTNLKSLFAPA